MENKVVKKPRLEWLDALRGFTMILVVANHVANMGFGEEWKHSSAIPFLVLFRMPLFFFVSGFLAYKASQVWNLTNFGSLVWKKIKVQTIPTVAFFFLAVAILNRHFMPAVEQAFHSPLKGGYWFTIALLYMFIIYYLFAYLESKLKWKSWIPITLLFLVSIAFYETNYQPQYFSWAAGYRGRKTDLFYFLQDSSLVQITLYFPFFLYGNIVHRYWDKAQRVMDSKWFFPILIVIVIFCTLDADVGCHSPDGVSIRIAYHHIYVLPPLPSVLHQVDFHGRFIAVYWQTYAGYLSDTFPLYARPASCWRVL